MKEIYLLGVAASFIFSMMVMIKNRFWNDFNECTTKSEAFGMFISVILGFFTYSLFSWIAFLDLVYHELFQDN